MRRRVVTVRLKILHGLAPVLCAGALASIALPAAVFAASLEEIREKCRSNFTRK